MSSIDEEIQKMIMDMEQKATQLLEKNQDTLDKIAIALLENETLENEEIEEILENGSN